MGEYHKIETLFARDETTKKLMPNVFRNTAVMYLQHNVWEFTEKIDGTNIRVMWDGHKVSFGGRTDNAQLPVPLHTRLVELFGGGVNEQLFEQKFGESPVMLVGEGYGGKIQKGSAYKETQDFILFDVRVNHSWLSREQVEDVAQYFGIDAVPIALTGTIQQAIDYVSSAPDSFIGTAKSEGVVGRPRFELYDNRGNRVIVKIKVSDFT